MKIGKKIFQIREDNKLTQEEFAEKLCVTRQTVSNWETDKCYPDIETLVILSDRFKVSLDDLIKDDREMVRDIDKKIKSYKYSRRFKVAIISLFALSALLFWYTYKRVLIYYYRVNPNLSMSVQRVKDVFVDADETLANMRFKGLNIYVPDDLERNVDDEDLNEMKFFKDGTLQMWFSKGVPYLKTQTEDNERFRYFGFDYEKLMKKYKSASEEALIDYYFEHKYETPNIFWSKSRIQMFYLACNYVNSLTNGGGRVYEVLGTRIKGYIHMNGNYYVMLFNIDDEVSYALRFNSSSYALDNVKKFLSGVSVDNLNFGDVLYH